MSNQPRRVRALRTAYVEHVIRKEGEEFFYAGEPNKNVFLELDAGDVTPVTANVPRKEQERSELEDLL